MLGLGHKDKQKIPVANKLTCCKGQSEPEIQSNPSPDPVQEDRIGSSSLEKPLPRVSQVPKRVFLSKVDNL